MINISSLMVQNERVIVLILDRVVKRSGTNSINKMVYLQSKKIFIKVVNNFTLLKINRWSDAKSEKREVGESTEDVIDVSWHYINIEKCMNIYLVVRW